MGKSSSEVERIQVTLDKRVAGYLDLLTESGLRGRTRTQVAASILTEWLLANMETEYLKQKRLNQLK